MRIPRIRHFTLIEMLAVMVVIAILAGVTIPVFNHLVTGTAVEAGARIAAADIRMARQYALSKHVRVAVLMPADQGINPERRFCALRPCIIDSDNVFQDWVPDSKWTLLPIGCVIVEVDETVGADGSDDTQNVTGLPSDFGSLSPCRAIVFRSNGRVSGGPRALHLVAGAYNGDSTFPTITNRKNYVDLEVDQYTGRLRFILPEDK